MTPQDVIDAARSWKGTPFHHQGRVKGVGVDCAGLIVEAFKEAGKDLEDRTNYGRLPAGGQLRQELQKRFSRVHGKPLPGDVLEMSYEGETSHLGIYTEKDTIIHANGSTWKKISMVVEHGYRDPWIKRTRAIWRVAEFS